MTLKVPCPRCGLETEVDESQQLPKHFPFCSERCRLVDLGRWSDGTYRISRPVRPGEIEETPGE